MSQFFASGDQNMLALFYVFRLMPIELVMPSIGLSVSIGDIEGVTHGGTISVVLLGPEPSL